MEEITVEAIIENQPIVTEFVDNMLHAGNCNEKSEMQVDIAIDELFSNVCFYAYGADGGNITIQAELIGDDMRVSFIDSGKRYNPLEKADPDINKSAEEREIGGLGIFMVKQLMDNVEYEYTDGKNKTTITKKVR